MVLEVINLNKTGIAYRYCVEYLLRSNIFQKPHFILDQMEKKKCKVDNE